MTTLAADREIDALMALHPKGFDLSLDRITRLLERLGNPQDRLPPVIHIAGTNGKGSCAAFSRALLEAGGHLVHVHTSPHLVNWAERYRLAAGCSEKRMKVTAVRISKTVIFWPALALATRAMASAKTSSSTSLPPPSAARR